MAKKAKTKSVKRVWSHFEDENGKKHKKALVDGYSFGDRLLEDVYFVISINDKGKLEATTHKDSKDYVQTLNEKMWLKQALEYAERNDMFTDLKQTSNELVLKDTNGFMSFENPTNKAKVKKEPVVIKVSRIIPIKGIIASELKRD
jgi:hypothetical protein